MSATPPPGRIPIDCPGCSTRHSVGLDERYPEAGGVYPCPKCRAPIAFPPRSFWLQPAVERPPAAANAAPPLPRYRFLAEDGQEELLSRFEVRDRIRAGKIFPDTRLSPGDADGWRPAGELPELKRYFELQSAARPAARPAAKASGGDRAPVCKNHPARPAEYSCPFCMACWCAECVDPEVVAGQTIVRCRADRDVCRPVVVRTPPEPLASRAVAALRYPFVRGAAIYLAIYVVLRAVGSLWLFFPPMTMPLLFATFLAYTYLLEIIRVSAQGETSLPHWPEGTDAMEWLRRGIKVFFVSLICLLPIAVFNGWMRLQIAADALRQVMGSDLLRHSATPQQLLENTAAAFQVRTILPGLVRLVLGDTILGLAALLYFPMALGFAAVWDTALPALNPVLLLRGIRRIGADYRAYVTITLPALFGLIVLKTVVVVLGVVAALHRSVAILFLGSLATAIVEAALTFWSLHLLGWMIYRHREDLGWD